MILLEVLISASATASVNPIVMMDLEKAFQVAGQHAKVITSNCVVSGELLDYKRKLEIKTTDLLWKDRESAGYQTELKKWRKECKSLGVDLSASKECSEQLLKKLATAQTLIAQQAASLKSVEAAIDLTEKLKKSEASLTATGRKLRHSEAEVKILRDKPPLPSQEELKRLTSNLKKCKVSENSFKTELTNIHKQLEISQQRNRNFEHEVEESRKAVETSMSLDLLRTSLMSENNITITEKEKTIFDLKEEMRILDFTASASREENLSLVGRLEKLTIDHTNLQNEKDSSVRRLENELDHLREILKDLEYTAIDREEIYCAMTDETVTLRSSLKEATANLANFSALAIDTKESTSVDKADIKSLKKNILRLRNQNQDLKLQIYQIKDTPHMKERELINLHHLAASAMKERQEVQDLIGIERKFRKVAENAVNSLNSELSFHQRQSDQMAEIRMTWTDQKLILKTEIAALHQSNKLLRKRIMSLDRIPLIPHANTIEKSNGNENGNHMSSIDNHIASEFSSIPIPVVSYDSNNSNSNSNSTSNSNRSHDGLDVNHTDHISNLKEISSTSTSHTTSTHTALQKKAEKAVERAMFDIICAFSSATDLTATRKKKLNENSGVYDVRQSSNKNGFYEVYFKKKNESFSIDAEELLENLQIEEFMKLLQNKMESGIVKDSFLFSLFAEKLASILNYHRYNVHIVYQQLLTVRMENTALLSRTTNLKAGLNTAKTLLTRERAWKKVRFSVEVVF